MSFKTIFTPLVATSVATLLMFGGFGVATTNAEPSVADTQAMTTLVRAAPMVLTHVHGLAYSADGKQLLIPSHHGGGANERIKLPALNEDAAAFIAQNPVRHEELAIATFKRSVYVTQNSGATWTQIADGGRTRNK